MLILSCAAAYAADDGNESYDVPEDENGTAGDETIEIDYMIGDDQDQSNSSNQSDDVVNLQKHATGNPILFVLVILSVISLPLIRQK